MWRSIGCLACVAALAGCESDSAFGFRLPVGDVEAGRQAFIDLRCNSCHEVEGVPIEYLDGLTHITLGGPTTRVKTYGELVTSIINPSHRIAPQHRDAGTTAAGESLMSHAYLNEVMTVQQLVDLVAFLEPTYDVFLPPPPRWALYQ